jgi:uncharacterized caspase-like protein
MGDVMPRIRKLIAMAFALIPLAFVFTASAARAEKRLALVVGNSGYQVGALATPANDAGLVAQTLQAAGFDVVGARDLDQDSLRRAFRDFLDKATAAGADTVAFIYVSGYGVQLEGENYFVPVDAKIARDADVAAEAIRLSDYIRPLAALKLKSSIVVLDAARANPFAKSGPPLAGGLALVEPEPGVLIAFNAAPGTVGPDGQGPYGPYAQALAEMMREGGLPLAGVFDRARLRVNDVTKGAEVPWYASKVETSLVFFERASDAPPPAVSSEQVAAMRARPMRDLGAQDAYVAALERDTLQGYLDFLAAYPDDPMAARVRAIVAARREAITWRRTRVVDTPPAYWSYLRRYPEGPHAADAHRRLAFLAAAFEPPPAFTAMAYDLPPPPPEEIVYIRRPVLVFDDPVFAFAPPPPPPVIFLAPPPPEFVVLAPPPPPVGIFVLPMPVYRPVPVWVRPPAYVAPPPNNVIYNNVHNTVVVNNVTNTVTITNPSGQTQTMPPAAAMAPAQQAASAPAAAAPAASVAPSLPPSVAQKAATLQPQSPQTGAQPNAPASAATQPPLQRGQPLPGMKGQPLPSATGTPATGTSVTPATPSAAITPGTPSTAPGSAKPATAPLPGPAAKPGAPSSPSAAITPGTPAPAGSAKPATSPSQTPAATPTTPSTAIAPATSTPAAGERAKRKTPPSQTPAAKPSTTAPSAAITPAAPSSAPAATAKPVTPPPQTPAAKPTPTTPSAAIAPGTQSPANKPATPTQVPAGKPATPSGLPTPAKPVTASPSPPPASVAKPATPPPQIPAANPAPPPAKPTAPAAAAAGPSPAAAPKAVPPQPKGCPAGKTMAVVNGQPVCK